MTGKKGFLGGLHDAIFEDEPDKKPDAPAHPAPPGAPAAAPPRQYVPQPTYGSPSGQVDPNIYVTLKKALVSAALPAYDAFERVMASFASIPGMTDDMKIQAAMAAVTAQGQNPGQVLIDINECLDALAAKEHEGNDAATRAIAACDNESVTSVKQMDAQLTSMNAQLAQLQASVAQLTAQRGQVATETATRRADLQGKQQRFGATVAQIRTELQQMREKLASRGQG